jgi:hypothetical protein
VDGRNPNMSFRKGMWVYSMRERDSRGKRRAVKAEKGPASGGRGGGWIVNQLK